MQNTVKIDDIHKFQRVIFKGDYIAPCIYGRIVLNKMPSDRIPPLKTFLGDYHAPIMVYGCIPLSVSVFIHRATVYEVGFKLDLDKPTLNDTGIVYQSKEYLAFSYLNTDGNWCILVGHIPSKAQPFMDNVLMGKFRETSRKFLRTLEDECCPKCSKIF